MGQTLAEKLIARAAGPQLAGGAVYRSVEYNRLSDRGY